MPIYLPEKLDEFGDLLRPAPKDVEQMIANAKTPRDKAIIALQYILGRRSSEIQEIRKGHIISLPKSVRFRLFTAKLRKPKEDETPKQKEVIEKAAWHFVDIKNDNPLLKHILNYRDSFTNIEAPLFTITTRTIQKVIDKTSEGKYTPHHFRHNRVMWLAEQDYPLLTIKRFHNRKSIQSLDNYLNKVGAVGGDMDIR